MAIQAPKVLDCEVTDCSYNQNKACHALAITVGDSTCPMCDTYFKSSEKGGAMEITGSVGACKENDCKHNKSLECSGSRRLSGAHSSMSRRPPPATATSRLHPEFTTA
jgi:hypothetical protein